MLNRIDVYRFQDSFGDYRHVECQQIVASTVEKPFFSIVIPAYKRSDTLATAIKSALAQDFKGPYEVIVMNNDPAGAKSGNEIYNLIQKIKDFRISYYVNRENIGLCGNWNRAVSVSRADNIVMVHDDDVLSEFILSVYAKLLKKYDDITAMGVGIRDFYHGNLPCFSRAKMITYNCITKTDFFFGRYIGIAGMFFKKHIALEIGGFRDEFYPNEDTIFIFQAILKGRVVQIENCLAGYGRGDNESMKGDTMKRVVLTMEATRRSMADHEWFMKLWMRYFGGSYFWQYVCMAEKHWHIELNRKELEEISGYKPEGEYLLAKNIMRMFQKVIRLYGEIKQKKYLKMEEYI